MKVMMKPQEDRRERTVDLFDIRRDIPPAELESMVAAMAPAFRPRSIEALEAMVNSKDAVVRAAERTVLAHYFDPDRMFDRQMLTRYTRGLLKREARSIMLQQGALSAAALKDQLIFAVGRAQPPSKSRPWQLSDEIMLMIINAVVADFTEVLDKWAA